MKSPFTGKEMIILKEWRTMVFRKEEFKVLFHTYKCEDTSEQFEDESFAELNYNQLVNQYREKHSIPFPEQIKMIREKYDMSASKMSEILGFGVNSYRQYEAGEIPSISNARLIQMAEDPWKFKDMLRLCDAIGETEKNKHLKKLEFLIEKEEEELFNSSLKEYFLGNLLADRFTGYKKPDFEKFCEMVVFFTEQLQPWKTKLNKLLFYADFTMFKFTGFSISGMRYNAINMGPVPNNFNSIFEFLANKDEVYIAYTYFQDGNAGEQFNPNPKRKFNPSIFSQKELEVLANISNRFKNNSTNQIIEISHQEKAWIENENGKKIIDYIYAFDLNV